MTRHSSFHRSSHVLFVYPPLLLFCVFYIFIPYLPSFFSLCSPLAAGSQCSHFTAENATDQTRVSLDFRVIIDRYWILEHDQFTSSPGKRFYYLTD